MSFHPLMVGANALCYVKNDKKYGMICAWASVLDYDKITMLLGAQSITGQTLEIGDVVGVSSLALGQKDVCDKLGHSHSNEEDKFLNLNYHTDSTAILINDAKANMVCKVLDIITKDYIPGDRLVVLEILSYEDNKEDKDFLPSYLAK